MSADKVVLAKVAGKKTRSTKPKPAVFKRPIMTSHSSGPGTMSGFKVNGVEVFPLVEWKQSMSITEDGLRCDGQLLVAFTAGDRWSCHTMSSARAVTINM